MRKKILPYVIFILSALGVGLFSAYLTRDSMMIYQEIERPLLAPPAILFPIVWTVLYILMGFGAAQVWVLRDRDPKAAGEALRIYILNLILNFGWSLIFFNLRAFLFALVWLILLWIVIFRMIYAFKKISPLAGNLQIPYLLWVTFAAYLNASIWLMNGISM